ncbi:MAG: hypothetical protein V4726_11560 [Verrucomicrobiota bacterium]
MTLAFFRCFRPPLLLLVTMLAGFQLKADEGKLMSPEIVQAIRLVTSEKTLLSLVQKHDLVKALNAGDEQSAAKELRKRIDIEEEPEGKGLILDVRGNDSVQSAQLLASLMDWWARESERHPERLTNISEEELNARVKNQGEIVSNQRVEVLRIMRELNVVDTSLLGKPASETTGGKSTETGESVTSSTMAERLAEITASKEPLPPEYLRAKRIWIQQLEILNDDRDNAARKAALKELHNKNPGNLPADFLPPAWEKTPISSAFRVGPRVNVDSSKASEASPATNGLPSESRSR